jgi:hypothetical protein
MNSHMEHNGSLVDGPSAGQEHPALFGTRRFIAVFTAPSPKSTEASPAFRTLSFWNKLQYYLHIYVQASKIDFFL